MKKKTHGTRYAYTTGCRCDECRTTNTIYMAQYRRDQLKRSKRGGWRKNRRWEDWEDELALDYSKSAWKIAEILERTPAAVGMRRSVLKARRNNQKDEQK